MIYPSSFKYCFTFLKVFLFLNIATKQFIMVTSSYCLLQTTKTSQSQMETCYYHNLFRWPELVSVALQLVIFSCWPSLWKMHGLYWKYWVWDRNDTWKTRDCSANFKLFWNSTCVKQSSHEENCPWSVQAFQHL